VTTFLSEQFSRLVLRPALSFTPSYKQISRPTVCMPWK